MGAETPIPVQVVTLFTHVLIQKQSRNNEVRNEGFSADVVFGLTKPFPNNLTELWTKQPFC